MVQNPTIAWRARMADGDAVFTEERIRAVEALLEEYEKSVQDGSEPMSAMQRVVERINVLAGFKGSMGRFIDTVEREELCAYIEDVARGAGATWEGNDPTEDWREW